jgi:hypothetical protein
LTKANFSFFGANCNPRAPPFTLAELTEVAEFAEFAELTEIRGGGSTAAGAGGGTISPPFIIEGKGVKLAIGIDEPGAVS